MKKAYLDANVLLAISAGSKKEPNQFKLASIILEEIKAGKITGIVSPLTLMEVIAVLRTQKGRERHNLDRLSNKQQLEFVLNESKSMYDKLMGELIKLPNLKFELGRHVDLNKLMGQALGVLEKTRGKTRFYHRCSRCGSQNVSYTAFKGLGSDDAIHALLARDAGCDCLVTFDKDFDDLKEFEEFEGLEFRVLK